MAHFAYRSGAYPTVSSHTGSWAINPNTHSLDWTTDSVSADTETTGSLEFSVGGDDAEAFFPVKVRPAILFLVTDLLMRLG